MGNFRELSINVVSNAMLKLLAGIFVAGSSRFMDGMRHQTSHRRIDRPCLSRVISKERGKPVFLPSGQADRKEGCRGYGYGIPEKANAGL